MQTPERTKDLAGAVMQKASFSINIWEQETSFFHGGHFKHLVSIKTTAHCCKIEKPHGLFWAFFRRNDIKTVHQRVFPLWSSGNPAPLCSE